MQSENSKEIIISKDIQKWQSWKSKRGSTIELDKIEDRLLTFRIDDKTFQITYPKNGIDDDTILLIQSNDYFSWIDRSMNYIMKKNPSLTQLLRFVDRQIKKEVNVRNPIDDIDVSNFYNEEVLIDQFDIQEVRYEKKLRETLGEMKSTLVTDVKSKASELFKGNVPGMILISMLMDARVKYNKKNRIHVSLKNDNIYHWIVSFKRFNNETLNNSLKRTKELYGYDDIQLEMLFHDKLFPSYPPFIKILRPRMENSLMHRISNLKMVHFDYWTPSRTIDYVIDTMSNILNQHASIDVENEMNNAEIYPNGAYHDLEGILVKLASLCNVKNQFEELDNAEYKKVYDVLPPVNESSKSSKLSKSKSQYWASGTGYGTEGSSTWNLDEYVQLQQERDIHIQSIIQRVTDVLMNSSPNDMITIYKILESSYLIPYIKTIIQGTTMVEIDKHKNLYRLIFTLLQYLVTEDSMFLFDDKNGDKNLFIVLQDMYNDALIAQTVSKNAESGDGDYDITSMITSLFEFVHVCFVPYISNKKKYEEEMKVQQIKEEVQKKTDKETIYEKYAEEMNKFKFGMHPFIKNGFSYTPGSSTDRTMLRTLGKECSTFKANLPVHYGSSVLARVDSTNSRCLRAVITGPKDTPYDSGFYIFDFYAPDKFPNTNPQMKFINHGGVRFNPNLYDSGKVCLSLLGTWRGQASENWNPKTSTISQLFISIQSQILTEDPYYNEPGWEKSYGTSGGKQKSKTYNNYIRQFNMQHAMVGIIEDVVAGKYPELKDAIVAHFTLKKDYILKLCKKWVDEAMDTQSSAQHRFAMTKKKYADTYAKLVLALDKL